MPRVWAAPPWLRLERCLDSDEVLRACRRPAPARAPRPLTGRSRPPARQLVVALAAARAERRASSASGGVSSSALVPVPWRSGTISSRARGGRPGEQRVELCGVEQRAVAGHQQHPLGPGSRARCDPQRAAGVVARARSSSSTSRRSRRRSAGRRGRRSPPAPRRRAWPGAARPARRRTSPPPAPGGAPGSSSSRSRCLASSKLLIGRMASVASAAKASWSGR